MNTPWGQDEEFTATVRDAAAPGKRVSTVAGVASSRARSEPLRMGREVRPPHLDAAPGVRGGAVKRPASSLIR
jgi:hypothetical protein